MRKFFRRKKIENGTWAKVFGILAVSIVSADEIHHLLFGDTLVSCDATTLRRSLAHSTSLHRWNFSDYFGRMAGWAVCVAIFLYTTWSEEMRSESDLKVAVLRMLAPLLLLLRDHWKSHAGRLLHFPWRKPQTSSLLLYNRSRAQAERLSWKH